MSEQKKRAGRPSKKDAEGNITVTDKTNSESFRKKTLSAPKSDPIEEEESSNANYEQEEEQNDTHDDEGTVDIPTEGNDMDDFDKALQDEIEKEFQNNENINDIPDDDFDPLKPPVKKRGYTGDISGANTNANNQPSGSPQTPERDIPDAEYKGGGKALPDIDPTLINPNAANNTKTNFNDIPNGGGGGNSGGGGGNNTSSGSGNNNSGGGSGTAKKAEPKVEPSNNLKELSPKEKREAVEETAEIILLGYQQYCPIPFIFFSSFSQRKLDRLHDEGEINLDAVVKRDGSTYRDYVTLFNQDVEEKFIIKDEEVEALRKPLIDVLMEKEVAMTPMQRLLSVAVPLIVSKILVMIQFLSKKQQDMDEMREWHQESLQKLEEIRLQNERILKDNRRKRQAEATQYPQTQNNNIKVTTTPVQPQQQYAQPQPQPQQEYNQPTQTEQPQQPQQNNQPEPTVTDAKIIEIKKEPTVEKTPTLDDVLEEEENNEEETDEPNEQDTDTDEDNNDNSTNDIPD